MYWDYWKVCSVREPGGFTTLVSLRLYPLTRFPSLELGSIHRDTRCLWPGPAAPGTASAVPAGSGPAWQVPAVVPVQLHVPVPLQVQLHVPVPVQLHVPVPVPGSARSARSCSIRRGHKAAALRCSRHRACAAFLGAPINPSFSQSQIPDFGCSGDRREKELRINRAVSRSFIQIILSSFFKPFIVSFMYIKRCIFYFQALWVHIQNSLQFKILSITQEIYLKIN